VQSYGCVRPPEYNGIVMLPRIAVIAKMSLY
jgi:hypothetical protein